MEFFGAGVLIVSRIFEKGCFLEIIRDVDLFVL